MLAITPVSWANILALAIPKPAAFSLSAVALRGSPSAASVVVGNAGLDAILRIEPALAALFPWVFARSRKLKAPSSLWLVPLPVECLLLSAPAWLLV